MSEEESNHPGSVALNWYRSAEKDDEGYGRLSELLDHLKERCEVRGVVFLKRLSSLEWEKKHGFRLLPHPWKPNRVNLVKGEG